MASDARLALEQVARGETDVLSGWLAYGAALNEGRALFASDEQFGQWAMEAGLSQVGTHEVKRDDRSAAMWAAANPDEFAAAQAAGNARTVRGIHAKWQEIDAERKAAEERAKAQAEREKAEKAEAKTRAEAEAFAAALREADAQARGAAAEKARCERCRRQGMALLQLVRQA